ncbi:hypothetical protein SDC9_145064 [bioreactor metagenome]|uniref:Uncharacterized protein n=1 Tax=bioreactor metagenome TaxID=1076179 RepID=A0A645E7J9_9ZZZZ
MFHVLSHYGNGCQVVFDNNLVDASPLYLFRKFFAEYFLGKRGILGADSDGCAVFGGCLGDQKNADAVIRQCREDPFVYADNSYHAESLYGNQGGIVDRRDAFDYFSVRGRLYIADKCALRSRFESILYADRYAFVVDGEDGWGIDHFCPEVGKLNGLRKREFFNDISRVDDFGVGRHEAIHIRPYFQHRSVKCSSDNGGGIVRSTPAQVSDIVRLLARRDKSRNYSHFGKRVT